MDPSEILSIFGIILGCSIIYVISLVCCKYYFERKDIDFNIITTLILFIPILNTIIALMDVNWKNVKKIFKRDKNYTESEKGDIEE